MQTYKQAGAAECGLVCVCMCLHACVCEKEQDWMPDGWSVKFLFIYFLIFQDQWRDYIIPFQTPASLIWSKRMFLQGVAIPFVHEAEK